MEGDAAEVGADGSHDNDRGNRDQRRNQAWSRTPRVRAPTAMSSRWYSADWVPVRTARSSLIRRKASLMSGFNSLRPRPVGPS
jgi:hypothetical protein